MRWAPILAAAIGLSLAVPPGPSPRPLHGHAQPEQQDALGEAAAAHQRVTTQAARTAAATQFVPNVGQWAPEVLVGALGDTTGWLHADGFTLRCVRQQARRELREPQRASERIGAVVRTRFVGSEATPDFAAPAVTRHHFLRGRDAAAHRRDVPGYSSCTLRGVAPGIDVAFGPLREAGAGPFAYDLLLAPGADLDAFVAEVEGVDALWVDADGRLCMCVEIDGESLELRHSAPVAWQHGPDGPRPLAVTFRQLGARRYGFAAPDRDPALAAVVDPGVVWSTALGGGGTDSVQDMVWRPGVGVWVGGWAGSTDFPTTTGAFRAVGGNDGYVAKLTEDGTAVVFATYFGGSGNEEVRGIAIGPGNTPTIVGFTDSTDLPLTPGAVRPFFAGGSFVLEIGDAFVARLSADGGQLLGSTYFGGTFDEVAEDVAVDAAGNAYVAGWTSSGNFPTTPGAWQQGLGGPLTLQTDGFVTSLTPDCTAFRYSTYVGGTAPEQFRAVDVDPATGEAFAAGWSTSANFPTTLNAYRTANSGVIDLVAVRLRANGSGAVYSTYLGGSGEDVGETCRLAADGTLWLGGFTRSTNFPTTSNAPQRVLGGQDDAVLAQLAANGQALVFATLHGGAGIDEIRGIAVQGTEIVAVGQTTGALPLAGTQLQPTFGGGPLDGFLARWTNGGAVLDACSYVGGADQDVLARVELDAGLCVAAGWTFATDFPTTPGVAQPQVRGTEDGVVLQVDLLTDLGDGLEVTSLGAPGIPAVAAAGAVEVLAAVARNRTGRPLYLDRLRVLLAGAGDGPTRLAALRVYVDDPATSSPHDVLVGGPVPVLVEDAEQDIALAGVVVPRLGEVRLRVVVDVASPANATVEVAAATVRAAAWGVSAYGSGTGPQVRVFGDGRVEGPVRFVGALPGDRDGDGVRTVFDLRRIAASLGAASGAADGDGDGVWTAADLDLAQAALLGRARLRQVPALATRGSWLTVRGTFPAGAIVDAVLGGRSLLAGRATPREATFFVDASQPLGTQLLQVAVAGRVVAAQDVAVQ